MSNRNQDWKRIRQNDRRNKEIRQTVFGAYANDRRDREDIGGATR